MNDEDSKPLKDFTYIPPSANEYTAIKKSVLLRFNRALPRNSTTGDLIKENFDE